MTLNTLTTAELKKELARRAQGARTHQARRQKLLAQLKTINEELVFLGTGPDGDIAAGDKLRGSVQSGPPRKRARNDIRLPDAIASSMELRAVVSPKEAARLVRANGFKTTSKNFNMMVSNALAKDKRFRRIGRGQYERLS
jgi:hypothetical protein